MFSVLNKRERAKPFVRDSTDPGADLQSSLDASTDADSYNRLRGMIKHTEREKYKFKSRLTLGQMMLKKRRALIYFFNVTLTHLLVTLSFSLLPTN